VEQTATPVPVNDDPQARDLLRRAFESTARWPKDFKGFTADLTVNVNGVETSGPVIVKGPREVSVQLGNAETQKWAQEQLGMIAVHRGPRSFEESDGKYTLTMEEEGHPFGTTVHIHGSHSFYRVKDNRITQINRKMAHPGMTPFAFTINVEESAVTQDQKKPHHAVHRLLLLTDRREIDQRGKFYRYPCPVGGRGSSWNETNHHI